MSVKTQLESPTVESVPIASEAVPAEKGTYGQILKSSALIGGSQVVNIGIGILRTKAIAILLGPTGVGLFGLYGAVSDIAVSLGGLGINSSGVRQIAEAVGSDDTHRIARTTMVLRRTSVLLGLLAAMLLAMFSRQISALTFNTREHAAAIALLSVAVCFRLISAGQGALIQGMRRIADLAAMGVLGAIFGTLISVPMVYFFREKGVVPALVGVAGMTILTSWWYSRKVQIVSCQMSLSQVKEETAGLLRLGFAFMASGFLTMGVAYGVRIAVLRQVGVAGAGLYQSAWTLGGLYVGFILQAMGADFYPRLTANGRDDAICNRLVNEQAQIGLLLAGPGVIGTLTFAALVLQFFYTGKFSGAIEILRWICLGTALQVVTWPMGFIILARGRQNIYFWSEVAWAVVSLGLAWVCIRQFGLNGAGIAFFGSYVFHGLLVYPIVRRLSGFRWSDANCRTGLLFLGVTALVFAGFYVLPLWLATVLGTLAAVLTGIYSMQTLVRLVSADQLPYRVQWLLGWWRLLLAGRVNRTQ